MSRGGRYARKREKGPLGAKRLLLLLLNGVLVLGFLLSAFCFRRVTHALLTQSADKVWRGENEMRFAQVTAFLPEVALADENAVESFRQTLDQKMVDASLEAKEGASLYVDAYSGSVQLSVTSDSKSMDVKAVGVGGQWFLFHPLRLRSGNYLSEDDYMQDRVVLDEELAWALFGSYDVAGMEVTIGDRTYPIAGVIHREDDFATKKAYADGAGLFMSYGALKAVREELAINCYELVMPDMISGFAYNTLSESFPLGNGLAVENSSRYSLPKLLGVLRDFGVRSMNTRGILYPYWENAARMTEDYAALLLLLMVLTGLCPLICAIVLLVKLVKRGAGKIRDTVPDAIQRRVEAEKEKRYVRSGI